MHSALSDIIERYKTHNMLKHFGIIWLVFLAVVTAKAQNDTVLFSVQGGFYEDVFSLELANYYPQNHIRYTTNGNRPTSQSPLYLNSILLDASKYSKSDIYTIQISPDYLVYVPDSVQHCIVIRAAVFDEHDNCVSAVMTNSYFIGALGCDTHGLSAVSICADSLELFDYETGIMVPGITFDATDVDHTGNYYQKGRDWEREVNVEFHELADNSGINQTCGLRTHGNRSRRYPSKGMKIYAREDYGKKRFKHNFFNDPSFNSYKHLVLKPFASFWPYSGVQDYFTNKLALQVGLPSSDSRPVVVYLNGEYWGVYFLQEKMDERFLEDHFGINIENCNIIGDWRGSVECGNNVSFRQMMNWFQNSHLDDDGYYQHACTLIDVNAFIDYMVFETYIGNWDWPGNNMRCWQEGNGKWRWIFFDGDASIIYHDFNVFENAAVYNPPSDWLNYPEAKLLFGKLLENDTFKEAFDARLRELCDGLFLYENTFPIYHDIVEALRPNIESQRHRFGYPSSIGDWEYGNDRINEYLEHRVENYLVEWEYFTDLPEYMEEMVSVYPNPSSGEIHLRFNAESTSDVWIAIYDVLGRKVFSKTVGADYGDEITLNPELPAGVYVLKVGGHSQRIVRY